MTKAWISVDLVGQIVIVARTMERWWSPIGLIGEANVFHIDLNPDSRREDEALKWLDERESSRWSTFIDPGPRRRFVLCRAALRAILGSELGCRREELEFGTSYYEKPFAIVLGKPHPISFNVSHSGKNGIIAFSPEGRLGVDVEDVAPRKNMELLAEAAFTTSEQAALGSVDGAEKLRLFFRIWTIKEALIKAVGMGLSLDMSSFEIPAAMRRGADNSVFSFPQAPSVYWRLESISNRDYCAAIAHEIRPDKTRPSSDIARIPPKAR